MHALRIIALAFCAVSVTGQVNSFQEEDTYDCLRYVGCTKKDQATLKGLVSKWGPKFKEMAVEEVFKSIPFGKTEPIHEDWTKYMDYVCGAEEKKVKEEFHSAIKEFMEWWERICEEEGEESECRTTENAIEEAAMLLASLKGGNVCGNEGVLGGLPNPLG